MMKNDPVRELCEQQLRSLTWFLIFLGAFLPAVLLLTAICLWFSK
jgi:hypothetical protein